MSKAVLRGQIADPDVLGSQVLGAVDRAALLPEIARAHRLQPLEGKPAGTLLIHEIYRSLQGESTFAGLPCVFIRLTTCHLRCVYCDTPHAFTQGEILELESVRRAVHWNSATIWSRSPVASRCCSRRFTRS